MENQISKLCTWSDFFAHLNLLVAADYDYEKINAKSSDSSSLTINEQ